MTPQKTASCHVFKMTIFSKLWWFHEPHNQVRRFRSKNKLFSDFSLNRKIVKQIVTFFAPQSLVHYKFLTVSPTPGGMKFLLSRYFLTFLQFHQEQELMNKEIRKWESSQNVLELQDGSFFCQESKTCFALNHSVILASKHFRP